MKFFVDAHLPPRLTRWLRAKGHVAVHASELAEGLATPDQDIWLLAGRDDLIIISKDADFLDMIAVRGAPPRLVHVAVGNATAAGLMALVEHAWPAIESLLNDHNVTVVQFQATSVVAWRRH